MASIGPIAFDVIKLGGNKVRINARYELQFTEWEVANQAAFIELFHLVEQEWGMDQHSTGNPVDGPLQWNYTHSTSGSDQGLDKFQGILQHQNIAATQTKLPRNITKELDIWKDNDGPNELYIVGRLIPHYRGTIRTSAMKQAALP